LLFQATKRRLEERTHRKKEEIGFKEGSTEREASQLPRREEVEDG